MKKVKIVISAIWYPLCMARYFWRVLDRRQDVELFVVGPFTGNWIPWAGGMYLPQRYVKVPDFPLPKSVLHLTDFNPKVVEKQLPWKPDLWLQFDAGWHFGSRPHADVVALIQTDPHCIDYSMPRAYSDVSFCMQKHYAKEGDEYLPYAADSHYHAPIRSLKKENDACLMGLQYEHRTRLVHRLRKEGMSVNYGIGFVYDEYRELYAKTRIALSWSSLEDLPARVFEAMYMAVPLVTNRVPDLPLHFIENEHYWGFSTLDEAALKVDWVLNNYKLAQEKADKAHSEVKGKHLYDHRIDQILRRCGYG